jgi:hypothetical protein
MGRAAAIGFEPEDADTAGFFCVDSCFAEELAAGALAKPGCLS